MLRRRIVILLSALLLSLAAPGVALAEEPDVISSPTIVSAVVDTKTGVATVTVGVTCLMDVGYQVRGEASLRQLHGSGRFAFSSQGGFGGIPCQAGDVLTFPVRFPPLPVLDKFRPGPAEIRGSWRQSSSASSLTTSKPSVRPPSCCVLCDGGGRLRPVV